MEPDDLLCSRNVHRMVCLEPISSIRSVSLLARDKPESQIDEIDQMNQPPLSQRLRELLEIDILLR